MKNIIDLLRELKEKSTDWKEILNRFVNDEIEETDELYDDVFSVFTEIREIFKNTKEIPEDICKEIDDPELVTVISDYIENSLRLYFNLSLLRDLQKENKDIAKELASIVLEEFIFHSGINGNKKIQKLLESTSLYDEKAVHGTIRALSYFTHYSIINNFTNECIKATIYIEGSLTKELSKIIADLIWKNRIELKMDYIIHQVSKT